MVYTIKNVDELMNKIFGNMGDDDVLDCKIHFHHKDVETNNFIFELVTPTTKVLVDENLAEILNRAGI